VDRKLSNDTHPSERDGRMLGIEGHINLEWKAAWVPAFVM